jgi:hypothetical protein
MAFTIPLTFNWLKHRLFAARRILCQQSPVYFVDKNPALTQIKNQDNTYILCPICGFSMAELSLADGWSARTCSAIGFDEIIGNPSVYEWLNEVNNKEPGKTVISNHLSIKLK